jgi:hypothetical protein
MSSERISGYNLRGNSQDILRGNPQDVLRGNSQDVLRGNSQDNLRPSSHDSFPIHEGHWPLPTTSKPRESNEKLKFSDRRGIKVKQAVHVFHYFVKSILC